MKIQSAVKTYEALFVDDVLKTPVGELAAAGGRRVFFVDANILRLYRHELTALAGTDPILPIDALENNKEFISIADYYRSLIDLEFTKRDVLVTVGGGILQDLSGFIASTLLRGIKWIFVPTTLLAQADSCIGSKTSINFGAFKNLLGTYYPPDLVLIDPRFCETLTSQHFNSGLGEIIKFHLMAGEEHLKQLEAFLASGPPTSGEGLTRMIRSNLEIKHSYFRDDEFDKGRRNLCNYGHCFGHALESASHFEVPHGEAVIVGMVFANLIARRRALLSEGLCAELAALLRPRFPTFDISRIAADDIIRFMRKDKKRAGPGLAIILLEKLGELRKYDDLSENEARDGFRALVCEWTATAH